MRITASPLPEYNLSNQATWEEVEAFLRPFAKGWIVGANIPAWDGQEDDIIDDVVQETLIRLVRYTQSTERGKAQPILSLGRLAVTVLRNCINDFMRRERRLLHVFTEDQLSEVTSVEGADSSEKVIEDVTEEKLFREVADAIAAFPERQRKAVLTDLANLMDFSDTQTPLQRAFQEAGIQLEDYRMALPDDSAARSRHAALVSIGYKRLREKMRLSKNKYIPA